MKSSENRRFPRIPHVSSRQIVHVDDAQNPHKNLILTENLSASGVKFTTNSRLCLGQFFLIYLNDQLMREIDSLYGHKKSWLKAGDYYLTKVVWVRELDPTNSVYEIGAAFIEKDDCREAELATFTELMNVKTLQELPLRATVN